MKLSVVSLSQEEILRRVKDLISVSNTFKHVLFKSVVLGNDVDKQKTSDFMAYINAFLRDWEEYVNELSTRIKSADIKQVQPGVRGILYSVAKPFLYTEYDYASILRFTDGLIRNINNFKFDDKDDITDYFEDTVSKSFRERSDSIAGLLSDIAEIEYTSLNDNEIKMFNGVKSQTLFQKSARKEIYKAIEKTMSFLMHESNHNLSSRVDRPKVLTDMINSVVNYAVYTLTAYITKIYVIGGYAAPFIAGQTGNVDAVKESVESDNTKTDEIVAPNISNQEFTYAKDIDESLAHDFRKWCEYKKAMLDWLKAIGAGIENEIYDGAPIKDETNNIFSSKLIGNPLIEFFDKYDNMTVGSSSLFDKRTAINNKLDTLHNLIYNKNIGIEDNTTAKQQLLHVIRGSAPRSESIDSYESLAADLIRCSISILGKVAISLSNIEGYLHSQNNIHEYPHNGVVRATECALALKDLYTELASATLIRAKDIELKLNHLRNARDQAIKNDITLHIPGGKKDDISQNDNNMRGVPETTRLPSEIDSLYAIPSFEAMQLYDEYVRSLPGMENVAYYSEALDISEVINKFMAWIKGLAKQAERIFTNEKFKAAVKWVNDHQGDLRQMTYNGILEVLPYRENIQIDYMNKVISTIRSEFKPDQFNDQESVNLYLQKIYAAVSPKISRLFTNSSTDNKRAVQLYCNWALYGKDPESNNADVKTIQVSNNDIKRQLEIWISSVADAEKTYSAIANINKDIESAINDIKSKMVNANSAAAAKPEEPAPAPPTISGESNTETDTTQRAQTTENNKTKSEDNNFSSLAVTKTQEAIVNIWDSIERAIVAAITNQYKYIQEAYTIGRKPTK